MKFAFLLFFIIPVGGFSQTLIKAKVEKETYLHSKIGISCFGNYLLELDPSNPFLVYDIYKCNSNWFFTTVVNKKTYYIDAKNIKGNPTLLDSMQKINPDSLIAYQSFFNKYDSILSDYNETVKKQNLLNEYAKKRATGLVVIDYSPFDESEYTNGTGANFNVANLSKKVIKYIWFNISGINPVGDKVSAKTLRGVGPIAADKTAAYNFNYVWFTDIVETIKLNSIKVQYMDGSIKTFTDPRLIIASNDLKEYLGF